MNWGFNILYELLFMLLVYISLNKYDYHIANIGHNALILQGHIDATLVIYVPGQNQLQYYFTSYCHIMPETYSHWIAWKCHMFHIFQGICGECFCIYVPHMNSLISTMWVMMTTVMAMTNHDCIVYCLEHSTFGSNICFPLQSLQIRSGPVDLVFYTFGFLKSIGNVMQK